MKVDADYPRLSPGAVYGVDPKQRGEKEMAAVSNLPHDVRLRQGHPQQSLKR